MMIVCQDRLRTIIHQKRTTPYLTNGGHLLACIYRSHCVVVGAGQRRVDHFPRDEGHRRGEEGMAPLVRNRTFEPLYIKRSFYQDRLGTDTGKTLQKSPFCRRFTDEVKNMPAGYATTYNVTGAPYDFRLLLLRETRIIFCGAISYFENDHFAKTHRESTQTEMCFHTTSASLQSASPATWSPRSR